MSVRCRSPTRPVRAGATRWERGGARVCGHGSPDRCDGCRHESCDRLRAAVTGARPRAAGSRAVRATDRSGGEDRAPGHRVRERVRSLGDVGAERLEQVLRRVGDVLHGGPERVGVARRRLAIAADLADVLERGGPGLPGRRGAGLVGAAELADASAHARSVPPRRDRTETVDMTITGRLAVSVMATRTTPCRCPAGLRPAPVPRVRGHRGRRHPHDGRRPPPRAARPSRRRPVRGHVGASPAASSGRTRRSTRPPGGSSREETGVDAASLLAQFGAYGDPGRDPRMNVVTVGLPRRPARRRRDRRGHRCRRGPAPPGGRHPRGPPRARVRPSPHRPRRRRARPHRARGDRDRHRVRRHGVHPLGAARRVRGRVGRSASTRPTSAAASPSAAGSSRPAAARGRDPRAASPPSCSAPATPGPTAARSADPTPHRSVPTDEGCCPHPLRRPRGPQRPGGPAARPERRRGPRPRPRDDGQPHGLRVPVRDALVHPVLHRLARAADPDPRQRVRGRDRGGRRGRDRVRRRATGCSASTSTPSARTPST